ncbi:hypothetical protein LTR36_006483 [Oleoguttula mirabilis]|uniref:Uncharacterized protein n=1 Tax=Oleoguttula mirabilis TaxID=1507867 RepID=A0AAV9JWS8_9PEZI|nr:hypothetical protein LTR36_006483 [Oleoguttula mirabilis]
MLLHMSGNQSGKIKFRCVDESRGGTFSFRNPDSAKSGAEDPELIQYIGTSGVKTCVGVYFKLSDDRCFLAHINGVIRDKEDDNRATRVCPSDADGEAIKNIVKEKLEAEAQQEQWDKPDMIIRESLLMVCPEPETYAIFTELGDGPTKQTGWWVAEGIREFLNLPDAPLMMKAGFVVGHRDGHRQLLTHDSVAASSGVDPPELAGYEKVPERAAGDWPVEIRR